MSVVANVTLSLSCVAHGPPDPVRVIWLQDGAPLNSLADPVALSPSTLNLTGIIFHSLFPLRSRPHVHSLVRPIKAHGLNQLLRGADFALTQHQCSVIRTTV